MTTIDVERASDDLSRLVDRAIDAWMALLTFDAALPPSSPLVRLV